MPRAAAVLASAGDGARFREALASAPAAGVVTDTPKTFLPLAGKPIWAHGAQALGACDEIGRIVVVVPEALVAEAREACRGLALRKVSAVVPGGPHRQASVINGLQALADDPPEVVAVHDGARPLSTPDLVDRCVAAALERGSGVAAIRVTDTLKKASPGGLVEGTVDRNNLWRMQTPQVFAYQPLLDAHLEAIRDGCEVTDDAAVLERAGREVWLVPGEETNTKVTTPADLKLAADILAGRGGSAFRVGHGFDAHRMMPGRPCILGGVEIPHDAGPLGHSDGDVLTHAIMDAVLGALALGDIGQHFPDSDPAYRGARSVELAAHVAAHVAERGYRVESVDATIIAQAPKVAPYVSAMRANLAEALGCGVEAVSVKATTTEGMGYAGTGEGIAAHALAVVRAS